MVPGLGQSRPLTAYSISPAFIEPYKSTKNLAMKVDGPPRGRGTLKKTQMEVLNINMKKCNLSKNLTQDRSKRINRICVANPNIVGTML